MIDDVAGLRRVDLNKPLAPHPLNEGRVGWWLGLPPLDGGNQWYDLTQRGGVGTLVNSPVWTPTGRGDAGLRGVSGSAQTVTVPSVMGLGAANASVFAWARCATTSTAGSFFHVGNNYTGTYTNGNGYALGVGNGTMDSAGNYLIAEYEDVRWLATTTSLGTGWNRVGLVINGSGYPTLYLNGQPVYSDTTGAPEAPTLSSYLGGYPGGSGRSPRFPSATVADVSCWNRALSPAEALADYDLSRRGYPGVLRRRRPLAIFVGGSGTTTAEAGTALGMGTAPAAGAQTSAAVAAAVGTGTGAAPAALTVSVAGSALGSGSAAAPGAIRAAAAPPAVGIGTEAGPAAVSAAAAPPALGIGTDYSVSSGAQTIAQGGAALGAGAAVTPGAITVSVAGSSAGYSSPLAAGASVAGVAAIANGNGTSAAVVPGGQTRAFPGWANGNGTPSAPGAVTVAVSAFAGGWGFAAGDSSAPVIPAPGVTFRRAYQTWGRRWRYTTVATPLLPHVNAVVAAVDDDRTYLFDFSACPEIVAGLTIVSATIVGGTSPPAAPLSIGTPAVLTQTTAGVAPGQGVQVEISGGTADTLYGLACVALLSNGRTVVVPAQLSVVTDY